MVFKSIKNYFKKHKILLFVSLLTIILVTLVSLIPAQLLRLIVDNVIGKNNLDKLFIFSLIYMLTYLLIGLINFFKEYLLVKISQGISKNLRLDMMKHVERLSYINFIKFDSATLEAYFSSDVDEIETLITSGVISIVIDSLKIIGIIVSIFIYSYIFGLIILILLPLLFLFTLGIKKRMYKAQKNNKTLEASVNNLASETLDNIVTIKSFRIYDQIKEKYQNVLNSYFKSNQKSNNYDSLFSPIIQTIKYCLIVSIILISGLNLSFLGLTSGVILSTIDLISQLFSPLDTLGTEIQTIQKSSAALSRINEFLSLEEDAKKTIDDIDLSNLKLEFKNVTFSYDGINNVLNNFNLEINNFDHLSLQGKSGSGKSTLFKLALGIIKPNQGHVLINGYDTYLFTNSIKQKIFGVVYQDAYFSLGTIKEELTLLDSNIKDEDIYRALNTVGLSRIKDINHKFILSDYSTGELALLNIARTILQDSKIVLLDEMNAKIDIDTSNKIIDIINKLSKDKMVISISHYGKLLDNVKILNLEKI